MITLDQAEQMACGIVKELALDNLTFLEVKVVLSLALEFCFFQAHLMPIISDVEAIQKEQIR